MSNLIKDATLSPASAARLKRMVSQECTCEHRQGRGNWHGYIHVAGCPYDDQAIPRPAPADTCSFPIIGRYLIAAPPQAIIIGGKPKPYKRSKTRRPTAVPSYRFRLQFFFTRPVNIELWNKIEAPPGWRKCPTNAAKQQTYRGVRFQCDDFKYALTPEEVSLLHMKLLMCLATGV